MKKIVLLKKIACLVMAFTFLNATLSYSYESVEDIRGFITYEDDEYAMLVDYYDPIVDEQFNKGKGVILITDDAVHFAFPGREGVSALLLNESTGESKILSLDNINPTASTLCTLLELMFLLGLFGGSIFVDVLFIYLLYCL